MKNFYSLLLSLFLGFSANAQIELHFDKKHIKVKANEDHKDKIEFYSADNTKLFEYNKKILQDSGKKQLNKDKKKLPPLDFTINSDRTKIMLTYNNQTVTLLFKDNSFEEQNDKTDVSKKVVVYSPDGLQTVVELEGDTDKITFYDGDVTKMNLKPIKEEKIDAAFFNGDDLAPITIGGYIFKKDNAKKTLTFFSKDGTTKIKTLKFKDNKLSLYTLADELPIFNITTAIETKVSCKTCTDDTINNVMYSFKSNTITHNFKTNKRKIKNHVWVTNSMEFLITGFNPFKYDVSLKDEQKNYNTQQPELFTKEFTVSEFPKAAKAKETTDERIKIEFVMTQLKAQLKIKLKELKNASDCYNPCDDVGKIVTEIDTFIKKIYPDYNNDLVLFMKKKMTNNYKEDDDDDKKKLIEFNEVLDFYKELVTTPLSDYVYKIPYVKNVDEYVFKLNITPKKDSGATARVLNQEIPVVVLGGFKVDFSTGLYFTSLINEKFSLVKDSIVVTGSNPIEYNKRQKIIRENGSNRDFGLSALMHIYTRLTTWVNPAITIGAGATLNEKPRLQYLVGGSLIFGRNGRLIFTYGATMGYVDQLSSRYKDMYNSDGNLYVSQYDKDVSLNKNFKIKPFFSITYNIPIFGGKIEEVTGISDDETSGDTAKKDHSEEKGGKADDGKDNSDKKALKKAIKILDK